MLFCYSLYCLYWSHFLLPSFPPSLLSLSPLIYPSLFLASPRFLFLPCFLFVLSLPLVSLFFFFCLLFFTFSTSIFFSSSSIFFPFSYPLCISTSHRSSYLSPSSSFVSLPHFLPPSLHSPHLSFSNPSPHSSFLLVFNLFLSHFSSLPRSRLSSLTSPHLAFPQWLISPLRSHLHPLPPWINNYW